MKFKKLTTIALGAALSTTSYLASATVLTFQNGYNPGDYAGTQDTEIRSGTPTANYGANTNLSIDLSNGGSVSQALFRFDNIFGGALIPMGSAIGTATLGLQIHSPGNDLRIGRMLSAWDEGTVTWNSFFGGGLSGVLGPLSTLTGLDSGSVTDEVTVYNINVTAELQAWANGAANYGWGLVPTGTDGVDFHASEHPNDGHVRPLLTVSFKAPPPPPPPQDVTMPEPSTLALMSLGLLGSFGFMRRKAR